MHARLAAAVLGTLCWAWPAAAAPEATAGREETLFIREVRRVEELSNPDDGKAFALIGRVEAEVPGLFHLRARRMVVWLHPDTDRTVFSILRGARKAGGGVPLWTVRAVYAEGGRVPALFRTAGRTFRCSSFYYDFERHKGVFLDTELRLRGGPDRAETPDLVFRARKFRATGPGDWRARDVELFNSNYYEPDVVLQVRRLRLEDKEVAARLGAIAELRARGHRGGKGATREEIDRALADLERAGGSIEGKTLTLERLRVRAFDLPVFAWRRLALRGDDALPLIVELETGGRGTLGTGGRLGVGLNTRPVGFVVGGGYYEDRGPLGDLRLMVDAFDGRLTGRSYGVYFRDRGADFGVVAPSRNRFWVQNRYRIVLDEAWRLDLEASDLSDRLFLRVWDEREFKEGKAQETLAYLRYRTRALFATATAKVRTIGFLDELEELPRVALSLPVLTLARLGGGGAGEPALLQLAFEGQVADLRHRAGDGSLLSDFRTARLDLDPVVRFAFSLGPVRIVPFAGLRLTAYERTLDGDGASRLAATAGVRADLQLSRWYGRWLHVVNVSLEFTDLFSLSHPAADFFPLDDVDRLARFEQLGVRVRQRWLRRSPAGLEPVVSLELFGAWFPRGRQPLGRAGDGWIEADLEWQLLRDVSVSVRAEVDPEHGRLETGSVEGWWQARRHLRLNAGLRHLEGDSDILTTSVEFEVDTRWRIVTFSQIDFRSTAGLDQGLLVQRLGKTEVVGFRFSFDPGDNEFSFGVRLDLVSSLRKRSRTQRESARRAIGWR